MSNTFEPVPADLAAILAADADLTARLVEALDAEPERMAEFVRVVVDEEPQRMTELIRVLDEQMEPDVLLAAVLNAEREQTAQLLAVLDAMDDEIPEGP